jgi:hypothetical protein
VTGQTASLIAKPGVQELLYLRICCLWILPLELAALHIKASCKKLKGGMQTFDTTLTFFCSHRAKIAKVLLTVTQGTWLISLQYKFDGTLGRHAETAIFQHPLAWPLLQHRQRSGRQPRKETQLVHTDRKHKTQMQK